MTAWRSTAGWSASSSGWSPSAWSSAVPPGRGRAAGRGRRRADPAAALDDRGRAGRVRRHQRVRARRSIRPFASGCGSPTPPIAPWPGCPSGWSRCRSTGSSTPRAGKPGGRSRSGTFDPDVAPCWRTTSPHRAAAAPADRRRGRPRRDRAEELHPLRHLASHHSGRDRTAGLPGRTAARMSRWRPCWRRPGPLRCWPRSPSRPRSSATSPATAYDDVAVGEMGRLREYDATVTGSGWPARFPGTRTARRRSTRSSPSASRPRRAPRCRTCQHRAGHRRGAAATTRARSGSPPRCGSPSPASPAKAAWCSRCRAEALRGAVLVVGPDLGETTAFDRAVRVRLGLDDDQPVEPGPVELPAATTRVTA